MHPTPRSAVLASLALLAFAAACASPPPPSQHSSAGSSARAPKPAAPAPAYADRAERKAIVRAALDMVGKPYRYGGASPRGFDCSGLVIYSYARAGVDGLPHSSKALASLSKPVPLSRLRPGDLLFFKLAGPKTSHVAIYVGHRRFVHAPSSGRRVETVSFDDVYWSKHLRLAGRLLP